MKLVRNFKFFFLFIRDFFVVVFSDEFKHVVGEIIHEVKLLRNLIISLKQKQIAKIEVFSSDLFPSFKYLISTNKGIYLLEKSKIFRLYKGDVHGLCINEKIIFFSVFTGRHSSILQAEICCKKKILLNLKRLISFETRYNNERIHGMCYDKKRNLILIANTKRNSILYYDFKTKKKINEIFVMSDKTKFKICTDHNHINNISLHNNNILFTCHNGSIGKKNKGGSLIGFIDKNKIYFYEYKNRGVHDIVLFKNNLLINDSFGNFEGSSAGPRLNGKAYKQNIFKKLNSEYMIRGLSFHEEESIFGCSGLQLKRKLRLNTSGAIILLKNNKYIIKKFDFSQVNEIKRIEINENNFDTNKPLADIFKKSFGKCVHVENIDDEINFAKLKTF